MTTISSLSKVAYMYDDATDAWYAFSGKANTTASYTWQSDHTFLSAVEFDDVVRAKGGVNNFQSPTARDTAIPSPSNGITCFLRQDSSGTVINQLQYYYNGSWRSIVDGYVNVDTKISDYTIQVSDAGSAIIINSSSSRTVTIPTNASVPFSIGQRIDIIRYGTGSVTIAPASGVTLNSAESLTNLRQQYSSGTILKTGTDTWVLIGDLD